MAAKIRTGPATARTRSAGSRSRKPNPSGNRSRNPSAVTPTPVRPHDTNTIVVDVPEGQTADEALARIAMASPVRHARAVLALAERAVEGLNLGACATEVDRIAAEVAAGELASLQRLLVAQGIALDVAFTAAVGAVSHAEPGPACDAWMDRALRAQELSRIALVAAARLGQPRNAL